MVTRFNATKHGPLLFLAVVVCVIACIIYAGDGKGMRSRVTDKIAKYLFPQKAFRESQTDKPYLIPNDEILSTLNESDLMQIYWRYVNTLQIICRNQTRLGSTRDGGREVCLDKDYDLTKPCIVYSFGSGLFDFDLDAHSRFGCAVYTFDPSMNNNGTGNGKKLPDDLIFKKVGLSDRDHVTSSKWLMRTLKTIMRLNGHAGIPVDLVKIDIEGGEWDSIPNFLQTRTYVYIKQLLVEFYFGHSMSKSINSSLDNMEMAKKLRALRMLYECGFRIFMKEQVLAHPLKIHGRTIMPQNKLSFVNIAFF